jgi:hypothetical protein
MTREADMPDLDRYRRVLEEIGSTLIAYGVQVWPETLDSWLHELNGLIGSQGSERALVQHVIRSRNATGGMGSLGDIVICPQAGHRISDEEGEISDVNATLRRLVNALCAETITLQSTLQGNPFRG